MSGIYIPGMEMPEPGMVLDVRVYSNNLVTVWDKKVGWVHYHAIPVPDHGRLTDLDSMERECCHGCKNEFHKYENCIDCVLANAPVIIPADKEGAE